jgi:hypothetical protein
LWATRDGWIARTHFGEACAALWLEGALTHLEDLVLHDAGMDVRAPTHELIRAHAILRARRRIAGAAPDWALSDVGLAALRGETPSEEGRASVSQLAGDDEGDEADWGPRFDASVDARLENPDGEFAEVDVLIARTQRVIDDEAPPKTTLVYDLDWRENERLEEWRALRVQVKDLSALRAGALLWEAWQTIQPLQHRPWLGALLIGAHPRTTGKTRTHLLCLNAGLRLVSRQRRRAPDRAGRLIAWCEGVAAAAEAGMKDHDRWLLARRGLERKLVGRRKNSHMGALVELVLAHPIASARMIAKQLGVTPRAAQNLVAELGLREATGRGRYRAWGSCKLKKVAACAEGDMTICEHLLGTNSMRRLYNGLRAKGKRGSLKVARLPVRMQAVPTRSELRQQSGIGLLITTGERGTQLRLGRTPGDHAAGLRTTE